MQRESKQTLRNLRCVIWRVGRVAYLICAVSLNMSTKVRFVGERFRTDGTFERLFT